MTPSPSSMCFLIAYRRWCQKPRQGLRPQSCTKKCRNFHSVVFRRSHFETHNNSKPFSSMSQSQSIEWVKQKPDNNIQRTRNVTNSLFIFFGLPWICRISIKFLFQRSATLLPYIKKSESKRKYSSQLKTASHIYSIHCVQQIQRVIFRCVCIFLYVTCKKQQKYPLHSLNCKQTLLLLVFYNLSRFHRYPMQIVTSVTFFSCRNALLPLFNNLHICVGLRLSMRVCISGCNSYYFSRIRRTSNSLLITFVANVPQYDEYFAGNGLFFHRWFPLRVCRTAETNYIFHDTKLVTIYEISITKWCMVYHYIEN